MKNEGLMDCGGSNSSSSESAEKTSEAKIVI